MHYEKLGRGRPVILVHGWLGSWRYWIPTMQQLHLKYSVYTLDLVGFGDSAKNSERYTIEHQSQLLNQFMELLAIPKAAMIGHGLGALVLSKFALHYPDKVARMLLVSLPLFDPGDLKSRTPDGTKVMLTHNTAAIPVIELTPIATEKPFIVTNLAQPTPLAEVKRSTKEMKAVGAAVATPMESVVVSRPAPIDTTPDPTLPSRSTLFAASGATVLNPLAEAFGNKSLLSLLEKCFKKSDPIFEKLRSDVEKTDEKVLLNSTQNYNASKFLDDVRRTTSPTLVVHGADDPMIPAPSDDVWQYLTVERDELFVPIVLPNIHHFPMLEYEPFMRLAGDFLETTELSKIEVRGRWLRRSR